MITALCIFGYIILLFLTAWGLHRWGDVEDKGDALCLGVIWPIVWIFLLTGLLLMPFIWIGKQLIRLWDNFEN